MSPCIHSRIFNGARAPWNPPFQIQGLSVSENFDLGVLFRNFVRYKSGVYQENLPGRSDAQNHNKYI